MAKEKKKGFDPEGSGYDYESAHKAGMRASETGHWSSREPRTGKMLKGKGHETWQLAADEEKRLGYTIYKNREDGRYYSTKGAIPKKALK